MAHRLLYHSTLGWRVIKKKKKTCAHSTGSSLRSVTPLRVKGSSGCGGSLPLSSHSSVDALRYIDCAVSLKGEGCRERECLGSSVLGGSGDDSLFTAAEFRERCGKTRVVISDVGIHSGHNVQEAQQVGWLKR